MNELTVQKEQPNAGCSGAGLQYSPLLFAVEDFIRYDLLLADWLRDPAAKDPLGEPDGSC